MIRYKLVKKTNRKSIMVNPDSMYSKTYKVGTVVQANPNTIGIFVFETLKDAENFGRIKSNYEKIIKVKPIGEGIRPKRVFKAGWLYSAYREEGGVKALLGEKPIIDDDNYYDKIPEGTICYPAVEVLT